MARKTALRRGSQEDGNTDYFTGCPIGGGFIWYGLPDKIPANCRICDNSTLAISQFAKLYENIGSSWGESGGNVNIPDLRGRFPRGVASGSTNDPDRASRTAANTGGNSGDAVGSVQADAFASHTHTYASDGSSNWAGGGNVANFVQSPTSNTGATGGNETRPKNANVYFVIRVE
jgi:microcystin-dependent protein